MPISNCLRGSLYKKADTEAFKGKDFEGPGAHFLFL